MYTKTRLYGSKQKIFFDEKNEKKYSYDCGSVDEMDLYMIHSLRVKQIEKKNVLLAAVSLSLIHSTLTQQSTKAKNCVLFMSINMQFGVFVFVSRIQISMCSVCAVCLMLQKPQSQHLIYPNQ